MVVRNFGDLSMRNTCHGSDSSVESVTSHLGTRSPAYQASGTSTPLFSTPSSNVSITGGTTTSQVPMFSLVFCQEIEDICGGVIGTGNDGGTQ
jgi:hypothetical protein